MTRRGVLGATVGGERGAVAVGSITGLAALDQPAALVVCDVDGYQDRGAWIQLEQAGDVGAGEIATDSRYGLHSAEANAINDEATG